MPTYDYACDKCGLTFERVQSMKDATLTVCPRELCAQKRWGRGRVKRLVGAGAGLIFKGSGFYITDYRSEGYKAAAKKDAPPAPVAAEPKSSTPAAKSGGETKVASKPESKPAAPAKP